MRTKNVYMSTSDAAVMVGVSVRTIKRYIQAGHLDAGTLPGGHVRVSRVQVLRLVKPTELDGLL